MFNTVLFPIDESREAREAVGVVCEVVNKYQSRLVVISVVEEPADGESASPSKMVDETAVAKLLEGAKALFAQKGITAEVIERKGMPAFTICDVADEVEANLIIMGSRGIGLTEEGAAESVTNRVINLAPCPVLVVP